MAAARLPMYYWVGKAIQDIRAARLAADGRCTQEHVAHEANISLRHYQKIEAGAIDVRLGTLGDIASVLRKKPQQVMDRAEELQRIGARTRTRQ